jgi:hypothetical protein
MLIEQEVDPEVLIAAKILVEMCNSLGSKRDDDDDVGAAKPKNQDMEKKHQCKHCSACFDSGQKLGGHQRMHCDEETKKQLKRKRQEKKQQKQLDENPQQHQEEVKSKLQKPKGMDTKPKKQEVNSNQQEENIILELGGRREFDLNRPPPEWEMGEVNLKWEEEEEEKKEKEKEKEKDTRIFH